MTGLKELRLKADKLATLCENVASGHYPDGLWGFYRAERDGETLPHDVVLAHSEWMGALHDYYRERDGEGGFLGGRGL